MPWAVGITEYVNAHSSMSASCWLGSFGYPLGTVAWSAWITSQPDFAAADAARGKLNADGDYLKKVSGSKGLFIEGSGHIGQVTRIA